MFIIFLCCSSCACNNKHFFLQEKNQIIPLAIYRRTKLRPQDVVSTPTPWEALPCRIHSANWNVNLRMFAQLWALQ